MMVGINTGAPSTIERIKKNTIGAEIGVWQGDTSAQMLKKDLKHLHLVDAWSPTVWFDKLDAAGQERALERYKNLTGESTRDSMVQYYEKVYNNVVKRFADDNNVTIHRTDSKEWLKEPKTFMFDWIYVDGDHSYEGCLSDLEDCLKLIKKDGTLFADDYTNKPGVNKAIKEFCAKHNFKFDVYAVNQVQIHLQ